MRRGFSLLELTIALGVVAVGLLGVLSVFAVGLHQTGRGRILDEATALAVAATQDFEVRRMHDPTGWVTQAGPVTRADVGYIVDPLFTSFAAFPANQIPGRPSLARVSLYSGPQIMPQSVANSIFRSQDDLSFELPADRTLPPINTRQSEGRLSWFAMLSPRAPFMISDRYTLSIVVCDRRVLDPQEEQWAWIHGPNIFSPETTLESDQPLDLDSGDWIMLCGITAGPVPHYQWIQVEAGEPAAIDHNLPGNTNRPGDYEQPIRLLSEWASGSVGRIRDRSGQMVPVTWAVIVKSVVAVKASPIRLRDPGMW